MGKEIFPKVDQRKGKGKLYLFRPGNGKETLYQNFWNVDIAVPNRNEVFLGTLKNIGVFFFNSKDMENNEVIGGGFSNEAPEEKNERIRRVTLTELTDRSGH